MDWRVLTAITVVCWGGYSILLKKAAGQLPWQVSMFLFVLAYAVLVGGYSLLFGKMSAADVLRKEAIWPIAAGLLCGLGGISFFIAIRLAPGSIFLPLVSLSMIISGIGCLIFFGEPVNVRIVLGVLFAAVAIVLLAR